MLMPSPAVCVVLDMLVNLEFSRGPHGSKVLLISGSGSKFQLQGSQWQFAMLIRSLALDASFSRVVAGCPRELQQLQGGSRDD